MNKPFLRFGLISIAVASALLFSANSEGTSGVDGAPCAVVVKVGQGTQVIPVAGKIQTKFQIDTPISCGSMVITHKEPMWIRHANQTVFKLAPDSFFELGKVKGDVHKLYRGDLMVNGAPSVPTQSITTSNGQIEFSGGSILIKYSADLKETVVASFSRSCLFQNKFSTSASQEIHTGEISRLSLHQDRIIPSQPEVVNPSSVKEVVARFNLSKEEESEMVAVVGRVFEGRAKSFVTDLENWKSVPVEPERSIASEPKKAKATALDEAEAKHTMEMMRERLYGTARDLKNVDEEFPSRKPASVKDHPAVEDPLYEEGKKTKAKEAQRLIDEVSNMKTED